MCSECPAFDGECICEAEGTKLRIERNNGEVKAVLEADLESYEFTIHH